MSIGSSSKMDKCRICLMQMRPKRLFSLFSSENTLNFSKMLCAIANVQVSEEDLLPKKICSSCSKRVTDAFELKTLAESSDLSLRHGKSKRINFSNINDLKIEIDIIKVEKDPHEAKASLDLNFNNKENVFYNDTIIKKVPYKEFKECEEQSNKKPLSVVEFLQNFKEEEGNDDDDDDNAFDDIEVYGDTNTNDFDDLPIGEVVKRHRNNMKNRKCKKNYDDDDDGDYKPDYKPDRGESDDDYIPCKVKKKGPKKSVSDKPVKKLKGRPPKDIPELTKVSIKPIYMPDIKVLPTKKPKKKKPKNVVKALCPFCGLSNPGPLHLLVHTGEKNHKCDQCPKSFFSVHALKSHQLTHGARAFKCGQCTAAFHHKYALKSHSKSHSTERKIVCDICNKQFKRRCTMRRHRLAHNTANKVIKCELCNMSFYEPQNLRHHMRVHTGERPYNCELCSQPYSYKHDFNRHCIKKHGVFLKRRSVNVMNAEVLARERALMQDLAMKAHGIVREGEKLNPFEGPQAGMAYEQVITAIQNKQIPVELPIAEPSLPFITFSG